ncbi:Formate hydrogenlyase subunit 3/Multisubunit Na+/H+ antiporter, MnhD subunit [Nitrosomonas sp. Nm51]|uniref:complex I subunit 5 family protein n=1 Tax=Nitrosomonas sp. Nm51 TaxID=133720 RepID=UPI0008CE3B7D|nr:proton-conducting transporter membrane subunit [Nitrosomonas sp. Nm51]SER02791.1 Formate hydrogenlyase subunit 3/Multisubunit Na+/H+ antiporter, MnhD subunit [Nitrosomonas sp. Nm51]
MNTALSFYGLLLGVSWPFLLVCLLGFKTTRIPALLLAPWAALPMLAASLLPASGEVYWQLPGMLLGSEMGLDTTEQVFMLLTAVLWSVSGVYARTYLSRSTRHAEFYIYFLLSMAGNFGLIAAQDVFGFYFGFSLMSFAAYGLIVFDRSAAALRAGRIYIILTVAGELMVFVALLMAAGMTGATAFDAMRAGVALMDPADRYWVILLGVTGFGIKAGMLGLHIWLPLAHPVAPAPASAVLSGAMIKAGLLGWLQLLPLGEMALPGWGAIMIMLGLAAALYGVVIGLMQHEPKTLLAYSSISQMGVMTMVVGLGMLIPSAWPLILPTIAFYALHHGLSKGALFLGTGLATGDGRRLPRRIWLVMWLPALALAGAPWTSGMLAKQFVKVNAVYAAAPWDSLLPLLLSVSALATALLMARLLYLCRPAAALSVSLPAAGLVWPWSILLLAVLLMPWWLAAAMSVPEIKMLPVTDSLWPVLVTAAMTWLVLRLGMFRAIQAPPAGDILVLMTRILPLLHYLENGLIRLTTNWNKAQTVVLAYLAELKLIAKEKLQGIENYLARWEMAMLFAIIMAVGIGFIAGVNN